MLFRVQKSVIEWIFGFIVFLIRWRLFVHCPKRKALDKISPKPESMNTNWLLAKKQRPSKWPPINSRLWYLIHSKASIKWRKIKIDCATFGFLCRIAHNTNRYTNKCQMIAKVFMQWCIDWGCCWIFARMENS